MATGRGAGKGLNQRACVVYANVRPVASKGYGSGGGQRSVSGRGKDWSVGVVTGCRDDLL